MGVSEPKSPPASFLLPFTPSRLFFSTAFNIFNTLLSLSLLSSRSQRKLGAVVLKSQFSLLSFSCTPCPALSSCQESFQLSARFPPRGPGLREQPGKRERAWWESFGTPPSPAGPEGALWESTRARRGSRPGARRCPGVRTGRFLRSRRSGLQQSRARGTLGSRGAQDFPSRPLPASSIPWLDRAWAAPGTWGLGVRGLAGGAPGTAGSRVSPCAGRQVPERT